jgi:adenosine deaminase
MRTHPIRNFFNSKLPLSISCDDPGFFGYKDICVSYDFYVSSISLEFDLKELKQICFNSIKHSLASNLIKVDLLNYFQTNWNNFVKEIIQ